METEIETVKHTTLAAALAAGATVILRGYGRVHSPGDVAYRLAYAPERGLDPPEIAGFFLPVSWRDGYGWRVDRNYNGRPVGLPSGEAVTVVE